MTDLATLKARILATPEARAEYEAQAPEFDLARELIAARDRSDIHLGRSMKRQGRKMVMRNLCDTRILNNYAIWSYGSEIF